MDMVHSKTPVKHEGGGIVQTHEEFTHVHTEVDHPFASCQYPPSSECEHSTDNDCIPDGCPCNTIENTRDWGKYHCGNKLNCVKHGDLDVSICMSNTAFLEQAETVVHGSIDELNIWRSAAGLEAISEHSRKVNMPLPNHQIVHKVHEKVDTADAQILQSPTHPSLDQRLKQLKFIQTNGCNAHASHKDVSPNSLVFLQ
jgi:hypothetical protein